MKGENMVMRKYVKVLFMMAMAVVLTVAAGIKTQAAETSAVTANLVGAEEDGTNVTASTYKIEENSGGYISIPIEVPQAGAVTIQTTVSTQATSITRFISKVEIPSNMNDVLNGSVSSKQTSTLSVYTGNAGTLYMLIKLDKTHENVAADIQIKAYTKAITTGRALAAGEWETGYSHSSIPAYYAINVKSSGLLKINTIGDGVMTTFCSSKKQELDSFSSGISYIGVRKGKYYIKVTQTGTYKLQYTFTAVKEKKNYNSKKAVTLKSGKKATGVFACDDEKKKKTSRWYKITVPSNKTIKVQIDRQGALNPMYLSLYQKSGKKLKLYTYGSLKNKKKNTGKVKVEKGTYYMELESYGYIGTYSIKWK